MREGSEHGAICNDIGQLRIELLDTILVVALLNDLECQPSAFGDSVVRNIGRMWTGAHPVFSQGVGAIIFFLYRYWPVGCEKSTLRKLFIMLQASSVLPHWKTLKKADFKNSNRVI